MLRGFDQRSGMMCYVSQDDTYEVQNTHRGMGAEVQRPVGKLP